MISAEIVCDSLGPENTRLTTFVVNFPRIVLAEFNTHRMFSRNSASSRAIPFKKMVRMVKENPFIPLAWQKDHRGMQGVEYLTDMDDINGQVDSWLKARNEAIHYATELNVDGGVTKQLCNRLLEPFMYHKVIITSSRDGLENFFKLRCPQYRWITIQGDKETHQDFRSWKDVMKVYPNQEKVTLLERLECNKSQAEIHIQALAEVMWDAYNASSPKQLASGEWHIPFGDNMDEVELGKIVDSIYEIQPSSMGWHQDRVDELKVKVAVARCARVSYQTFGDNPKIDYEADIKLYDRLVQNGHASPLEHVAQCCEDDEYYYNIKGFKSKRYLM